ncbi:MAG: DUF4232 domain-containing protein [Micromonosporaceae bacterium]|nr:DUF4232 domain-containing protein [Micromonosporaceae bacterium]
MIIIPGPARKATLVLALALVIPVTACESKGSDTAAPSASPSVPSESPSLEPEPSGTSPEAPPSDSGSRCTSDKLRVEATEAGGGNSAGHQAIALVFTNTGSEPCTMLGYPGVSLMTSQSGSQVNDAATRTSGTEPQKVALPSKGTAQAIVLLSRAGFYDEAECKPVDVAGFRVYPPDETTSLFASSPQTVCSKKGTAVPSVGPVEPMP